MEVLFARSNVIDIKVIIDGDIGNLGGILDLGDVRCGGLFGSLRLSSSSFFLLCFLQGLGGGESVSLSFLLGFNKETLVFLNISLIVFSFLLFFLSCAGLFTIGFFAVGSLVVVLSAGQPGDEFSENGPHGALSLAIVHDAVSVELDRLGVPSGEERVFNDAVVVELLAESGSATLSIRVPVDKELNDSLQHVLLSILLFLAHQRLENRLVSVPVLRDVSVRSKDTNQADVEFVLTCDVELELCLTYFTEDVIRVDWSFSFFLSNESREFFTSGHYSNIQMVRNEIDKGFGPIFQKCIIAIWSHRRESAVVTKLF